MNRIYVQDSDDRNLIRRAPHGRIALAALLLLLALTASACGTSSSGDTGSGSEEEAGGKVVEAVTPEEVLSEEELAKGAPEQRDWRDPAAEDYTPATSELFVSSDSSTGAIPAVKPFNFGRDPGGPEDKTLSLTVPDRLEEIRVLADFLADRAREDHAWAKNMILLGDFNIFRPEDETMKAILDAGFQVPKQLQGLPSNVAQDKFYDQIAFIAPDMEDHLDLSKAGVFNFFDHVYREEDEVLYTEAMGQAYLQTSSGKERDEKERAAHYRKWRTYQMSDHLPMWVELKIDFGREYLEEKAT